MRNAGLDELQARIKTGGRNINNLRYADDTTLMAESEEELKSLLRRVKEKSEKADLKLNTQKTKIMASSPIMSWQIDEETIPIPNVGLLLRRCSGTGLHLAMTGEPRGFSRGVARFSNYDGEFRMPLVLAQGSPIFHSSCEGKLGIALE